MANTKSAIKRIRRISKQTAVNKIRKSRYKSALKQMNLLINEKKKSEALKFLPKLNSELMKIAKTGIIKKKNASRNISRLTKKISSIWFISQVVFFFHTTSGTTKSVIEIISDTIFRFSKYLILFNSIINFISKIWIKILSQLFNTN